MGHDVKLRTAQVFKTLLIITILILLYNIFTIFKSEESADNSHPVFNSQSSPISRNNSLHLLNVKQLEELSRTKKSLEKIATTFTNLTTESLSRLQLANGGTPIRNLIFATWRSGSTFVGEAVANHALTFYHYEPLIYKGIVQIGPESADLETLTEAKNTIKSLLNCDYFQVSHLVDYYQENQDRTKIVHNKNPELWESHCKKSPKLCKNSAFLSEMCKLFPYQAMKLVRLRLKLAEDFLLDTELDVKILHLVRDPRGTLHSRRDRPWCTKSDSCHNPASLCADMVLDFYTAQEFRARFPNKFLVLRYEDISLNLNHGFEILLKHFRLGLTPEIQSFLDSHTIKSSGPASSTFRDSKTVPFKWIVDVTKSKGKDGLQNIQKIEKVCQEAMSLWGYIPFPLNENWREKDFKFNPLSDPPWSEMRLDLTQ